MNSQRVEETTKRETAGASEKQPKQGNVSSRRLSSFDSAEDRQYGERILKLLEPAERVFIVGHERPDGDCIAGALALCGMLRRRGFKAEVIGTEPVPRRYRFLDVEGYRRLLKPKERFTENDLVFVIDSTEPTRTGAEIAAACAASTLVNIDHHIYNTKFGTVNWVDSEAAATGELIWRMASCLGWTVTPTGLQALYVALVTDTGQFSYSNTTPRALRMAAELVEAGVEPETIWRRIYLDKTPEELALEKRARESLDLWADGRIAVIGLRHTDFAETRTNPQAASEFTNIPRSVIGARLALFFYEIENGAATKVSIRSVKELDACRLARRFGGGGHLQAAGCTLMTPLEEAMAAFRPAAEELAAKPSGDKADAKP